MDKQKGLTPILIILLIAGIIGGYLIYQKQSKSVSMSLRTIQPSVVRTISPTASNSSEMADWKTYKGKNYTFRYPNTWIVKNKLISEDKWIPLYILSSDYVPNPKYDDPHEGGNIVGAKNGSRLEVLTELNPLLITYEDEKRFHEGSATKNWHGRSFKTKEEIIINGEKAMLLTGGKPDGLGTLSAAYFVVNQRRYNVVLISSQNHDALFKQILSTIKFIP